jgi:hypothetical protein
MAFSISFNCSETAFSGLFDLVASSVLSVGLLSSITFNLTNWIFLGNVFAVKPISKKRLPEVIFIQSKEQFVPTAQLTPQIHRMQAMLKPDSHEFTIPLMSMKQLSVRALRLDCDNL